MLKNPNYLLHLGAFGLYFGIFNAISIVLSYLIEPFFSKDSLPLAVAAVGGSPVISGIIGVIILGPMQRKSGNFKNWIIFCMCGSLFATAIFYPLLLPSNLTLASFISAFNSFFLIPLVPIMLELGCELVFPVGEGSAVGLLFAVGNFGGFLLGLFLSMIAKGQSKEQTAAGIGFCFGM